MRHAFATLARMGLVLMCTLACARESLGFSVPISYRLPFDGQEKTYRVTLVVALKEDPDWIVGHVLSGAPRTVNAENKGEFTDTWDGNDDNFAPMPSGAYMARGIYMPAEKWKFDDQWHSLIPKFVSSPGDSWAAPRDRDHILPPVFGHLMEPFYQISVADNGIAVFWAGYLENAWNPFIVDMNKPVGVDQVTYRFPSGGCAGGHSVAYDGKNIWMSRHRFVTSPTLRGFGEFRDRRGRQGTNIPGEGGVVTDMNVMLDAGKPYLYIGDAPSRKIYILDGLSGKIMNEVPNVDVIATLPDRVTPGKKLYILHRKAADTTQVIWVPLSGGVPSAKAQVMFDIPAGVGAPGDLTMDKAGNFYVVGGGFVYKLSPGGKILLTFGVKWAGQGKYNPDGFMGISSIECWRDKDGKDRLVVCESSGVQRLTEWSCETGKRLPDREWHLCQNAYSGYSMDPAFPNHVYGTSLISAHLMRWYVNYDTGAWKLDAVWPLSISKTLYPEVITLPQGKYVVMAGGSYRVAGSYSIYKVEGYTLRPSAGLIGGKWWHDANGDGRVDDNEYTGPNTGPGGRYWGDMFLRDLSLCHIKKRGVEALRLEPAGFDDFGNPVFDGGKWASLLLDTVCLANLQGKGDPLRGRNEVGRTLWDWSKLTGTPGSAIYMAGVYQPDDKGGIDTAGKVGDMWKLTCFVPGADGKLKIKWRVGRDAPGVALPGEVYGSMHVSPPLYGMIGIHDANGIFHVFTDKGMYVDTLLMHTFRFGLPRGGMYSHSGESWFGKSYLNRDNGNVYVFYGRASFNIYEVANWKPGVIKPLQIKTRDGSYEARD